MAALKFHWRARIDSNLRLDGDLFSTRLRELDGGDWPLSIVASDGDSQAVHLIESAPLQTSV
jgi:hypothetical protein